MNKEELKNLRTKYEEKIKEREKLQKAKKRLKELKSEPLVREYIGLSRVSDKKILSNEDIIKDLIFGISFSELTNILVYMGIFNENLLPYNINLDNVCYHLYWDIEQKKKFYILDSDKEEYEKNKIIINLKDGINVCMFYKIREFYFTQLINGSNEQETLEKIKVKSKDFDIEEIRYK